MGGKGRSNNDVVEQEADPPGAAPPSPPREMPQWARSHSARGLTIAGVVFVLMGLVTTGLYYALLGTAAADEAIDARGERVMATPVSYRLSSTSQGGAVERYDVTFAFSDDSGNELTTTIETDHRSQRDAAKTGTPLEIEYDPANPQYARWPGTKLNPLGNVGYWLTGAFAAFGVLLGLLGLRRGLADRRVYRQGVAQVGRVDRVESSVQNQQTVYDIAYSYAAEGTRVQAIWKAGGIAEPTVGPIWVIVDARDAFVSVPFLEG